MTAKQVPDSEAVLRLEDLEIRFPSSRGVVRVLEGVSFSLFPGEILALVGETGCGKSVTAKSILNLTPGADSGRSGAVWFDGRNLLGLGNVEMQRYRGRRISMVFQNPQSSINPVFTLGEQIFRLIRMYLPDELRETRIRHSESEARAAFRIACRRLSAVGLNDVERVLVQYAHQISGGMAQRYRIATAMLSRPEVMIADEATSALDVTVQANILKLFQSLCRENRTAILLITHDLGIAAQICDRIAVMYAGRVVELAETGEIFDNPLHPYTRGLLQAVPQLGARKALTHIAGMIPDLANAPGGCRFHPRCPDAMAICARIKPGRRILGGNHRVACHLYSGPGGESPHRTAAGREASRGS